MRLDKHCRIAERYTLIQLGLTIVGRSGEAGEERLVCASYNLFAFPYVGPELLGGQPGFFCQATALHFNSQHHVDFNKWIGQGIPYMSREDEERYLKASGASTDGSHDDKIGLLRLWKSLCKARLPFVVHCPLDLFFLLAAFEKRRLPRGDPRELAMMIRRCTPKVYDTAHLHGALGRFRRLGLVKFCEDAKAQYDELAKEGNNAPSIEFKLLGETAARYSKIDDDLAHEAGYDSLLTAQLFAYLRAISPSRVREAANRLYLYKSVEFIDLDRATQDGQAGTVMFDLSRVTLLVAALDVPDNAEAARLISAAGSMYKWMDPTHILVILRASGGAAVRKAADLAAKVHGVSSWMGFDEWKAAQALGTGAGGEARQAALSPEVDRCSRLEGTVGASPDSVHEDAALENGSRSNASAAAIIGTSIVRRLRSTGLLAAAFAGVLLVLSTWGRGHLATAGARFLQRWRRR